MSTGIQNSRCKVGDRAIVIRSALQNTGKIVRIIREADQHEYSEEDKTMARWIVETEGSELCVGLQPSGSTEFVRIRPMDDAALFPIRDEGEQTSEEDAHHLESKSATKKRVKA